MRLPGMSSPWRRLPAVEWSVMRLAAVAAVAQLFLPVNAAAEFVFLKDGAIVECKILNENKTALDVRLGDGTRRNIDRRDVLRIQYAAAAMRKVYVQRRDGVNIEAFIVDEDQDAYTLRKILDSPEEFTMRREEVLFIAEKNPSGLTGEPATDRVALAWFAPYNPVKRYIVYLRESPREHYRAVASETGRRVTVTGLRSNAAYWFIVTAVDAKNYESRPSNEIKIVTKNLPPDPPEGLTATLLPRKDGRGPAARLSWKPARDPDGTVTEYRVYRKSRDGSAQIGKTRGLELDVEGSSTSDLSVRAVDERGDESSDARLREGRRVAVTLGPAYLAPLGTFGRMLYPGVGAALSASLRDAFLDNLVLGIETGCVPFAGKEEVVPGDIEEKRVYSAAIVPVALTIGWMIAPIDSLSIVPRVSLGGAYSAISYRSRGSGGTGELKDRTVACFNPLAKAGVMLGYSPTESLVVSLGAEYWLLFENRASFALASLALGVGVRF